MQHNHVLRINFIERHDFSEELTHIMPATLYRVPVLGSDSYLVHLNTSVQLRVTLAQLEAPGRATPHRHACVILRAHPAPRASVPALSVSVCECVFGRTCPGV